MSARLASRYESIAPRWGRRIARLGFPGAYRALVSEALSRLPVSAEALDVLDLGCGDGALAEALANLLGPRAELTLLDLSPAMLRAAEARLGPGRARLVAGDVVSAALAPATRDIVASAHLLEHLPDPRAAARRMADMLRPGGVLILCVSKPHWCSRLVWFAWRHRVFTQYEMLAMLGEAGLTDLHCWQPAVGPPRRLSLAYAGRKPG
jgi:ubiquinone/menaquinone biosynthesis C-methylase UbiE